MSELLYLDTARLGQMSPSARRASVDFARFASEYGCSLYLNQFLENGFDAWPAALRDQFPGLQNWHGVTPLKEPVAFVGGSSVGHQRIDRRPFRFVDENRCETTFRTVPSRAHYRSDMGIL